MSDVITFYEGTYGVELTGHDVHGVVFSQQTSHTLTFDSSNAVEYTLSSLQNKTITMDRMETLSFSFHLYNPSIYSTTFNFASTSVKEFRKRVTPTAAIVGGKESVEIQFTVSVKPQYRESLTSGSRYRFTLFTSNGCVSYSISKTVIVAT